MHSKRSRIIIGVVGMLILVGIVAMEITRRSSAPTQSNEPKPVTNECAPENSDKDCYVGLTEEAARARAAARGLNVRIIERDGTMLPMTMDYRKDRLNFALESGHVKSVSEG